MALSQITTNNARQGGDYQAGFGQLRNGFRHLLQFIDDGHLQEARQAYTNLSQTLPDVFGKLSSKLTDDYDAIGRALKEGDMDGAQKAVVQLKQDLQGIGRTENLSRQDASEGASRNPATTQNNIIGSYHPGNIDGRYLGTRIDIYV